MRYLYTILITQMLRGVYEKASENYYGCYKITGVTKYVMPKLAGTVNLREVGREAEGGVRPASFTSLRPYTLENLRPSSSIVCSTL